jgi:hypothetical protein
LLNGSDPVVTSELTRIELASAVHAAHRAGRLGEPGALLDVVDADCAESGPIALLRMQPEVVFGFAADLLARFPLRTLDALHLAVAQTTATQLSGGEPIALVSRDDRQRAAAEALGMPLE